MRVGIYVRVSTIEAAKEGYSIAEQEKRLMKYCDAKDWDVYHVYIDGGYSGASTDRPALHDMIKDVENRRIDAVLVYKLDRLSRSQKDTMELIEDVFLPNSVDFVSMTENLDTTSPVGMAMIGLLSVFAQLERAQIAERMAIGIEGRAKDGKWHGAACSPVGYDYREDMLHVIPYEAMMVNEAFELFVKRVPIYRICAIFADKGYRHRYGYFLASSMRKMLQNPLYMGYIEKNGELYDGKHDGIVSKELFEKAQIIFEERDKENPNRKSAFKCNSYLAGLLECKKCGSGFCKTLGHVKNDGTKSAFYCCYSRNKKSKHKIKDPNCKNKIWRMEELDGRILAEITKLSFDPAYIEQIQNERKSNDDTPRKISMIEKRIEELSDQISLYSDLYSIKSLTIDEVKEKIDPLAAERESLRSELSILKSASNATIEETYRLAQSFGDVLESGEFDRIRFTIEELIDKIVVDDENVSIFWRFA